MWGTTPLRMAPPPLTWVGVLLLLLAPCVCVDTPGYGSSMAGTNVVVTEGAGGQYTVAEVASGGLPDLPVGTLHTVYGALASLNSGKHRDGVIVIGGVVSMGPADAFTEIGQMIQLCKIAAHLPHRMDPARCTHAPNAAPIACPGGLLTLRRLETDGLQLQGRPGGADTLPQVPGPMRGREVGALRRGLSCVLGIRSLLESRQRRRRKLYLRLLSSRPL